MKFIVSCTRYDGRSTTKWIEGADFWEAVEAARYLPERQSPLPPKPMRRKRHDHLYGSHLHEWEKECTRIRILNDARIATVEGIRPFAFQ